MRWRSASRDSTTGGVARARFDSRRFTRARFFFGGASDDAPKSRCEVVLAGMCAPRAIEKPVTLRTRSRVGRWAEFIVDEYRIMRTLWTLWPSGLRRQIKENTRRNYGKNNARDASRARARFRTMREQSQRNILVRKGVGSNPTGVIQSTLMVNFCSSPERRRDRICFLAHHYCTSYYLFHLSYSHTRFPTHLI